MKAKTKATAQAKAKAKASHEGKKQKYKADQQGDSLNTITVFIQLDYNTHSVNLLTMFIYSVRLLPPLLPTSRFRFFVVIVFVCLGLCDCEVVGL